MDDLSIGSDILSGPLRLLVALAVGLLIGMEREWRWRGSGDEPHVGLRTFGLIGLLGGLAGMLQPSVAGFLVPGALLALAVLLLSGRRKSDGVSLSEDMTTLVAALVTLLLGALAAAGMPQLAAASAVVVVVLLNFKRTLHGWIDALSEIEIRAVMQLLIISLVILPVLPDRGFGPYQALNPRSIWWFVVLVSTLSFVGYLAIRILGPRRGYLAAGLFGGLVSSTATTAALARLGRRDPGAAYPLAAAVAVANAVMAIRMTVIVAAIDPNLAMAAAWPLGWAALAALLLALVLWRHRPAAPAPQANADAIEIQNPFDIWPALRFAALLAVVLVLARFLEAHYGQNGVQVLAAIAGLVDVDAITLTVARGTAPGGALLAPAVLALLIAALANSLFKGALLLGAGGRLALWGVAALAAMAVAGGIAWLIPPPWLG
jgi:uncharacterized membrane protein (DUF4010 family)